MIEFSENEYLSIKQPKYVAFDIGNVICHVDLESFYNFLVKEDIAPDKQLAEEFISGIQYPQDLGLYNIRQGFYRFNPELPRHKLQELHDAWLEIVSPSDPMIGVIDDALSAGYEVALLSNIGFDHSGVVRQKCKVFQRCHQHFSCEVGARKPTKLFYQSFMMHYNWPQGEVFLDDRRENIEAARPYFNGVVFDIDHYEQDEDAANAVRDLLKL